MLIQVYEAEWAITKNNHMPGKFELTDASQIEDTSDMGLFSLFNMSLHTRIYKKRPRL